MENKIRSWIYLLLVFGLCILNNRCKKEIIPVPTVIDIEGNIYHSVTIGTQTWMAENLRTTKYNDGSDIPNITESSVWQNLGSHGYCWYNNDIANKETYGALYNWFVVSTAKLCPTGWHVPTESDWTILSENLGGDDIAGGKLKEAGNAHWLYPNSGATNESRFTALAGGYRNVLTRGNQVHPGGFFGGIKTTGSWWTASEFGPSYYVWYREMNFDHSYFASSSGVIFQNGHSMGYSVRCIKD